MTVKKIYFDMDGVLADFDRGVEELAGIPALSQGHRTAAQDDAMWETLREVEHFYDRLEPIAGALEVLAQVRAKYGDAVEILSGIPKPRRGMATAGEDKTSWVRRHVDGKLVVNLVFRAQKKNYALGPDCILIDDFEKNIREWEAAGGSGILFTDPKDVLLQLERLIEAH